MRYRIIIPIYLVLSVFPGFMYSAYLLMYLFSLRLDLVRLILLIFLSFLPYILVASGLSLLAKMRGKQITSGDEAILAIAGVIISFALTLIAVFAIVYLTLREWRGYEVAGPASVAGMPEILSAWVGGCSSGFIVLSIGYLMVHRLRE